MKVSDPKFRALLERYLNNSATQAERELLDRFFNSYGSGSQGQDLIDDERLRDEMLKKIHTRVRPGSPFARRTWFALAAAAVSLVVLMYFIRPDFRSSEPPPAVAQVFEVETQPGQRRVTHLPDGTTVHLNGNSRISYKENFGQSFREVAMEGEAYFEVIRNGQPFMVNAGNLQTHVLGTSFNVRNRSGESIEVTLVEGKVVLTTVSDSTVLYPEQLAVLHPDSATVEVREANIIAATSWKDNVLFFEKTSLKEAIRILEKWYAVEIDIADAAIEGCAITAKYKDEPLGNVLSSFQYLLKLDIKKLNEKHYRLSGKGCR